MPLDLAGLPTTNFAAKAVIFMQGEPADVAYVLVSGLVAIMAPNKKGELVALSKIGPGQIFGEMALIVGTPRTAMAVADEPSVCIVINREALTREMSKADPFLRSWIQYMSARLIDISGREGQ